MTKWGETRQRDDLKTCPFCGTKAIQQGRLADNSTEQQWRVLCGNPFCRLDCATHVFASITDADSAWEDRAVCQQREKELTVKERARWEVALAEYAELREEIGRLEEQGECSCDVNEFHTCTLCAETTKLDQRARALMNLWGDTWAMKLAEDTQFNEPWHDTQERLTDRK